MSLRATLIYVFLSTSLSYGFLQVPIEKEAVRWP